MALMTFSLTLGERDDAVVALWLAQGNGVGYASLGPSCQYVCEEVNPGVRGQFGAMTM